MKRKEYIMHLLSELASFILDTEPSRMVISLHQETDGLHLVIIDNHKRNDEELAAVTQALNQEARPEMADYYGSMAGSDLLGSARLNLIGWQVKRGDVNPTDNGTRIDLWLGSDNFNPDNFTIDEQDD
mgnify:CR=1 FL=1